MKIAIISDTHFGFSYNTERREDSFIQGEEAVEKALAENVDLILLAGDIFDSRVPTQDVLGKAMKIFRKCLISESRGVELDSLIDKDETDISKVSFKGTPVIAIHGTHERRGKGLTNPVQLMEKAGLLVHLHCNSIILKKGTEKVAVHGMSGVPERYARTVLEKWSPKPVKNALNILVMHQSIGQYIYSEIEAPTIDLEDLPKDFDLIVNGHIHWTDFTNYNKTKFLIPGSTITTQMKKLESERKKGFYIYDEKKLDFRELETLRNFFYKTLKFDKIEPDELSKKIREELGSIQTGSKKPMVRLVLKGTLKKGFEKENLELSKIEKEFKDKMILQLGKEKIFSKESSERKELLEEFRKKQLSVDELGYELLRKHLQELDYKEVDDTEELLNQLVEGNVDMIYKYLRSKRK